MKCSKSAGYDKISVKLVKDASEILSELLGIIFSLHFSSFSRLLEPIGHGKFYKYLKEYNKFVKCQHAFLKLHSTLTSLLSVTDKWFSNIDKRKRNISIFLDLKKAVDTMDHGILLSKLRKYGAVGTPLRWFTS